MLCKQSLVIPQITPLHIACRKGNKAMVELLLPSGEVNKADQVSYAIICLI